MKKIIGITGGIASGKSTVCSIIKEYNYPVIDSDLISKELSKKGNSCYKAILEAFGEDILLPDLEINRKKLGEIIFNNNDKKLLLNSVTHPLILNEIKRRINECDTELVFVDIPLLFESKMEFICDYVICVYVDRKTQITRLMKRDSIDVNYALAKINSQMDLEKKKELSDYVLDSSSTINQTKENTIEMIKKLKEKFYGSSSRN